MGGKSVAPTADGLNPLARLLISLGVFFILVGLLLLIRPRFSLFKLPGDILVKKKNLTFYFPLATSLLLSFLFTLILNLILWLKR